MWSQHFRTATLHLSSCSQLTNSAKNSDVLSKLFFLKRLEVIISFFKSCRLVTLSLKGIIDELYELSASNLLSLSPPYSLVKIPLTKLTSDIVSVKCLGREGGGGTPQNSW